EARRTRFEVVNGEPLQVIEAAVAIELPVIDLRGMEDEEKKKTERSIVERQAHQEFDLRRSPLLRAVLVQTEEQEHVLVLVMHHIVSDGWSLSVFTRELAALYRAYLEGREVGLKELEVQYGDYAVWQREWLQGEVLQKQLRYWKEQLSGIPELLELSI